MSNGSPSSDRGADDLYRGLAALAQLSDEARQAIRATVIQRLLEGDQAEPAVPGPTEIAAETGATVSDVVYGGNTAMALARYVITEGGSLESFASSFAGEVDLDREEFDDVMTFIGSIVEETDADHVRERTARERAIIRGLRSYSRATATADLRVVKSASGEDARYLHVPVGIVTLICSTYGTEPSEYSFQLSSEQLSELVETLSELQGQLEYLAEMELPSRSAKTGDAS